MFTSKSFNMCLLISTVWHLVCFSAVKIVVLPEKFDPAKYTEVYFLGPILEKTIFDMLVEEAPKMVRTAYMKRTLISEPTRNRLGREDLGGGASSKFVDSERLSNMPKQKVLAASMKNILDSAKRVPRYSFAKRVPMKYQDELSELTGSVAGRKIFYKPPFPTVQKTAYADDLSFMIELKFEVLPEGRVANVEPVISSGYPDIDLLGMRYLKRWRFEPLAEQDVGEKQWGRIRLNFQLQ